MATWSWGDRTEFLGVPETDDGEDTDKAQDELGVRGFAWTDVGVSPSRAKLACEVPMVHRD